MRAAALGGVAVGCLVLLGFLLPIGLALFLGEWVFGSIGWGVLLGTELLLVVVALAGMAVVRARGIRIDFLIAVTIGVIVALLLGPGLPNELWRRVGEATSIGGPDTRPLLVGTLVMGIIGGLLGLLLGARAAGGGGAVAGLVAGAVGGALLGAFSAITFGWRVGTALGVAVGLIAWPALMAASLVRDGVDLDELKSRFWPQETIDTTKETIEWAKTRSPLGPRS